VRKPTKDRAKVAWKAESSCLEPRHFASSAAQSGMDETEATPKKKTP